MPKAIQSLYDATNCELSQALQSAHEGRVGGISQGFASLSVLTKSSPHIPVTCEASSAILPGAVDAHCASAPRCASILPESWRSSGRSLACIRSRIVLFRLACKTEWLATYLKISAVDLAMERADLVLAASR